MGWWRTSNGGIIGDGPANIIDEVGKGWTNLNEIPAEVRKCIVVCYREDFDREPTEQEWRDLLLFCGPVNGEGSCSNEGR